MKFMECLNMIKVQGERIKGFLYDSLETAQSDLEVNEVIVTNNS